MMPVNINYYFNIGVCLLFSFFLLFISGLISVVFYSNNLINSFFLIKLGGSFFRDFLQIFHNSLASFYFIFIFLHIIKSFLNNFY